MSLTPLIVLQQLWNRVANSSTLPPELVHNVHFSGPSRTLASSYNLTQLAQGVIGASGLAAIAAHRLRGGPDLQLEVDSKHAAIEFHSEGYCKLKDVETGKIEEAPFLWDKIAGTYKARDNRWLRLHTNFAHHRDGVLALLNRGPPGGPSPPQPVTNSRDSVAHALETWWTAAEFEQEASEAGMVVSMMRSGNEFWEEHPQGKAIKTLFASNGSIPVNVRRIDDGSPAKPLPQYTKGRVGKPLDGVRILDLTRIIAAPVGARTLANYGAEVLRVSSPNLPDIEVLVKDCGRGKRSTHVDLNTSTGRDSLAHLVGGADVIIQSYRPGSLDRHGFSPSDCFSLRPGLVYASLNAYGSTGPWRGKRGFDSLVQTATGFNVDEARAYAAYEHMSKGGDQVSFEAKDSDLTPRAFPCQALDHASGYLLAFGVQVAILRRAVEGGSYTVEVSLAETALWLRELGQVGDPAVAFGGAGMGGGEDGLKLPTFDEALAAGYLEELECGWRLEGGSGKNSKMVAAKHAAVFTTEDGVPIPMKGKFPAVPNGTHPAEWW
ncbi:hypothetical protein HDU93_007156 [Gonapodya sp. JEL0774]|nr:hypothetical protein HDU93_007156 [Gonapodya sp. JEL0774]